MGLAALKVFLPSKYLLAVALVLPLASLWYLQLANNQADDSVLAKGANRIRLETGTGRAPNLGDLAHNLSGGPKINDKAGWQPKREIR